MSTENFIDAKSMGVEIRSLETAEIDPVEEKKFVHAIDWRLMPIFATMYFFSSLDRSNIGNAKVAGLTKDLGISDSQYSTAVSILYATYIPIMVPGVWVMVKFFKGKERYYLTTMMVLWSLVSIFTMFINGYGTLILCRLLVGLFEGSFFSCMGVITTDYYFQEELGRRFSYLFVSSSLSSAFGGLIATGITKIHSGPLAPWKYLYMIEGLLSLVAAVWLFFGLPQSPDDIIKTESHRKVYNARTARRVLYMGETASKKEEVLAALSDWKLLFSVIIQFCADICLYGYSTFLPVILKSGLGFSSIEAQYLSVPVYLIAGFIFFAAAELSDKFRRRALPMIILNCIGIVGYILILAVAKQSVKYFGCYLIAFPLYAGTGINEAWVTSNTAPRLKRSVSLATNQALGNLAGIISGQVYRDSPKYILGHVFTIGCLFVACGSAAICSFMLNRRNKENSVVLESGEDTRGKKRTIGDDSPEFKFII
ncbi:hypothetical protein KL936_004551 [Ogataea polymorpha]|nr:hypothetical protein KL936_004551 [Ogataea polymorpha]